MDKTSAPRPGQSWGGRPCPACGSHDSRALGAEGGYRWGRCRACRTTFVQDQVTQADLDSFYADYYTEENLDVPPIVLRRLDEVVTTFSGYRRSGRLLDVGFGAGTLLEAAGRAGWECWGTEVSESAIAAAQGAVWTSVQGDLPRIDLPSASFDVVCLVEVLEHVPVPQEQLVAALSLLRPGGLLYGTTPSGRGLSSRLLGLRWSAYAAPEHLQLMAPHALALACTAAGFESVRVQTRGTNPYELRAGLRSRSGTVSAATRVQSGYDLNARLESSSSGRRARGR